LRSPTPHYGLGLIYYERHDLLRARSELEKASERNSESFRARALLGRVLRDLGKTKEALVALADAERDAPALTTVHAALGRLYLDLGRYREARAQLRTVIDGGKASADDKLGYAEASLQLGFVADGEKAIQDALDAGALAPKVARLRLIAQSWKGAKEALVAARLIDKMRIGPGARDVSLAILDGDAWRRAGDLKRSADAYRSALFGDPLHANLGLGRVQLAAQQMADAEVSYRAASGAWEKGKNGLDDLTDARVGLGRVLLQKKAAPEATGPLLSAVGEDPESPDARFWLGRAYADQGQADKARPQLEKATELDDHFTDAWLLLGDMSRGSSKDKARTAYKKVLELDPNGAQAKAAKKALAALK
jgi:tetratricopeptide (TPR) repeat protein